MKIDYCNLYIRFSTRKIWCLLHSKNSHVGHSNLIHGSTQIRHVGLNSWIFRKIFEFQTWYIYFWQRLLYLCILKSRPLDLLGEGGGASSHVAPTLPKGLLMASTLEIELKAHWWEASAWSQLLHPCSLLLSNCKIISTLIITLECNNYMLHCNNWYSKMKLNNFIIPLYCCDSKSNFCAGFFFALKWNKLQWAEYLIESMTCNICLCCQYASLVSICMCGKCNGCAFKV